VLSWADGGNVVSADEDGHVRLRLAATWIDDGNVRDGKGTSLSED
jgi:hypothetical protein